MKVALIAMLASFLPLLAPPVWAESFTFQGFSTGNEAVTLPQFLSFDPVNFGPLTLDIGSTSSAFVIGTLNFNSNISLQDYPQYNLELSWTVNGQSGTFPLFCGGVTGSVYFFLKNPATATWEVDLGGCNYGIPGGIQQGSFTLTPIPAVLDFSQFDGPQSRQISATLIANAAPIESPEPGGLVLMGTGLLFVCALLRRASVPRKAPFPLAFGIIAEYDLVARYLVNFVYFVPQLRRIVHQRKLWI